MKPLPAIVAEPAGPAAQAIGPELDEEDVVGGVYDIPGPDFAWHGGKDLTLNIDLAREAAADDDIAGAVDGHDQTVELRAVAGFGRGGGDVAAPQELTRCRVTSKEAIFAAMGLHRAGTEVNLTPESQGRGDRAIRGHDELIGKHPFGRDPMAVGP